MFRRLRYVPLFRLRLAIDNILNFLELDSVWLIFQYEESMDSLCDEGSEFRNSFDLCQACIDKNKDSYDATLVEYPL